MQKLKLFLLLPLLSLCFSSCAVIGGIFKAGVWVGVTAVVLVVGLIIYFISRGTRKS